MPYQELKQSLIENGFAVVRGLLSSEEAQHYINLLEEKSGITRQDLIQTGMNAMLGKRGLNTNFSMPDGVAKSEPFWSLIVHKKLNDILTQILDPDIKFLQHNDLHVGFSAISWHRDNINRQYGVGSDWQGQLEPYKLVRVGIYLQSYEESGFRLGFIPGSHKPPQGEVPFSRRLNERKLNWIGAATYLSVKMQERVSNAQWIQTNPGDCIIFDPRTLHSGSYIIGPKFSIFLAYGKENSHFYNHFNYYRNIRSELGYQPFKPELVNLLKANLLYQEHMPMYDSVADAWTPPPLLKSALARRFKM